MKKISKNKSQDLRTTMLLATLKIIGEGRPAEISLERVGKIAGVGRSHVVYYFKTIDNLIMQAMLYYAEQAAKTVQDALLQTDLLTERVEAYLLGNLTWATKNSDFFKAEAFHYYLAICQPKYKSLLSKMHQEAETRLCLLLSATVDKKLSADNLKIVIAARTIRAYLTGGFLIRQTRTNADAIEKDIEAARQFIKNQINDLKNWTKS